jgi:hypothetical protein
VLTLCCVQISWPLRAERRPRNQYTDPRTGRQRDKGNAGACYQGSTGREEERLIGSTVLRNAWLILCHAAVQINQPNRPRRSKIHSIFVLSPTPATRTIIKQTRNSDDVMQSIYNCRKVRPYVNRRHSSDNTRYLALIRILLVDERTLCSRRYKYLLRYICLFRLCTRGLVTFGAKCSSYALTKNNLNGGCTTSL